MRILGKHTGKRLLFTVLMTLFMASAAFAAAKPAKVSGLKVKTAESSIVLSWKKVRGASGYYIYRKKEGQDYKKFATVKTGSTVTYKVKKVVNNQKYTFRVCAYKKSGSSVLIGDPSGEVIAYPKIKNPGKVKAKLYANGDSKVVITWNSLKKATSYEIFQKDKTGKYVKIGTTTKNKVTVKKLKSGQTYSFKVRAVRTVKKVSGYGAFSAEVSGQPAAMKVNLADVHGYYYRAKVTGVGSGIKLTSTDKAKTRTFKAGTKVVVTNWGSSKSTILYKNKYYKIKTKYLSRYNYVWDSSKPYSKETAEAYVNYKGYTSGGKYFLWISTYTQHMYVFQGSQYNWKLIYSWKCSTAKWGEHTYYGFSKLGAKQRVWEFGQWQVGYYASHINGGAIHSELYYKTGGVYEGVGKLGNPSSHGCVRIALANAKWVYDVAVPTGSEVLVY